jgi:clan AA aspartic protease (TIGR02281 family)
MVAIALFAGGMASPVLAQTRVMVDGQAQDVPAGTVRTITYFPDGRQSVIDSPFADESVPQAVTITTTQTTEEDEDGNPIQTVVETRIEPVAVAAATPAPIPAEPATAAAAYAPRFQTTLAAFPPLPPIQIALPLFDAPAQAMADVSLDAPHDLRIGRDPTTGHFIARIRINGVEVRAIVDTGAQETILSAQDARATGATHDVIGSRPMAGIGGYTMLSVAHVRSMEVGGQQLGGFSAAIGQEGIPFTLLGQTEITRLGRIVIEDGVMTITPRNAQMASR